jgi:hypothetical protein
MKPTHLRISDLWCRLMHAEPMWPSHGQYECRTCGRRYPVCWESRKPGRSHSSSACQLQQRAGLKGLSPIQLITQQSGGHLSIAARYPFPAAGVRHMLPLT